jgi:hypothetical protein
MLVYHSLPEGRSGYLIGFDSNLWCDLPGSTVSKMIEFFFELGEVHNCRRLLGGKTIGNIHEYLLVGGFKHFYFP